MVADMRKTNAARLIARVRGWQAERRSCRAQRLPNEPDLHPHLQGGKAGIAATTVCPSNDGTKRKLPGWTDSPPHLQGGVAGDSANTACRRRSGEAKPRLPGRGGDGISRRKRPIASPLLTGLTTLAITTLATAAPATVIEPPGDNLPPAGRSLFDHLLAGPTATEPTIPFPIGALLQRIRAHLDPAQPSGGLPVVLIPLGRSLQRHAAGDVDAFRYPRVVAAVTGEAPPAAAPGHLYLKDRLYVAYHEKSAALEVISYNDDAGRFEFQLVRDYRAGGRPQVGYANRALCLSCHHNAAPIFSRQSWDETAASPPVAARLAATEQDFYGLDWRRGVDVPDAIDGATARTNLYAAAQRLWRDGCGAATPMAATDCRAGVLRLALRYRLGGGRALALDDAADRQLADSLLAGWRRLWPAGLAVADPSLPNRQPFAGAAADADPHRLADVAAAFDPLALRPPLEAWQGNNDADLRRFIHVAAQFFSAADIALLDSRLGALVTAATPQRRLELRCSALPAGAPRLDLDCHGDDGSRLLGRIHRAGGNVDRLNLADDSLGAFELGKPLTGSRFRPRRDGLALRTAAGEALHEVELRRGDPPLVSLLLVADLAPLDQAIAGLARNGGGDAFADAPLRRDALLPPLLHALGIATPAAPAAALPPPQLADPPLPRSAPWPADLQPFARNCGQCHAADSSFPPGFLHGDDDAARAAIARCAERIAYRLAMNRQPPAIRPKTPMPPPAAAHAAAFARSSELAAMLEALGPLLAADPSAPTLLARPYASLAPCTAARAQMHAAAPARPPGETP